MVKHIVMWSFYRKPLDEQTRKKEAAVRIKEGLERLTESSRG